MKTLFVFCALCSNLAVAQVSPDVKPDPAYTHHLSSSGPLSKEQLLKQKPAPKPAARSLAASAGVVANAASSNTYTYLRCWYRTNSNPTKPTTTYVWGLDPSNGDYYRINGYWWAGGLLNWENMFYSDVAQSTLQSVCQSTLTAKGISQPVAMVAAADNALSFNYTVWTTDSVAQSGINKIVAFGDSLSDTQNIYNASEWTLPNSNSWFLGHFSNGKNWVEYLADDLQLPLYNWAIGGAGVTTQDLVIPGVIQQVQSYVTYMQEAQNYQPQNTLFTLLIGGNDLVNYNSTVDQVMSGETQALQSLIQSGARNILLLKLPDVSKAPVFTIKTTGPTVAAQVIDLNNRLTALVSTLQAQYGSSLHIQLYDTYALFNDLLTNPSKYQVSNTTQSCLNINTDSSTNYLSTQTARSQCSNPDTFVFWDTLHPTTHTHKLLADAVAAFYKANLQP
jgi:thermolabile hemolysin